MAFDSKVSQWLIFLALFVAIPVFLGLAIGASRLLRIKSGCLPVSLFLLLCGGLVGTVTLILDSGGIQTVGEVLGKTEGLAYRLDGGWNRVPAVVMRYNLTPGSDPVNVKLSLEQTRFDDVHQGDFLRMRVFETSMFRFTRLADRSTYSQLFSLLLDRTFVLILLIGFVVVIAARLIFHTGLPLLFFMIGAFATGAWWVSDVFVPLFNETQVRMAPLNTVSASVREIHPLRRAQGGILRVFSPLLKPYEVVLLDMIPLGRAQPLLAVDVVDQDSVSVRPGEVITVEYSPAAPRVARLRNASRDYLWINGMTTTALTLIVLLLIAGISLLLRETPLPLSWGGKLAADRKPLNRRID